MGPCRGLEGCQGPSCQSGLSWEQLPQMSLVPQLETIFLSLPAERTSNTFHTIVLEQVFFLFLSGPLLKVFQDLQTFPRNGYFHFQESGNFIFSVALQSCTAERHHRPVCNLWLVLGGGQFRTKWSPGCQLKQPPWNGWTKPINYRQFSLWTFLVGVLPRYPKLFMEGNLQNEVIPANQGQPTNTEIGAARLVIQLWLSGWKIFRNGSWKASCFASLVKKKIH